MEGYIKRNRFHRHWNDEIHHGNSCSNLGKLLCRRTSRVVLNLEQPAQHSKPFPMAIDPANVQQELKRLVKAFDPHPSSGNADSLGFKTEAWE